MHCEDETDKDHLACWENLPPTSSSISAEEQTALCLSCAIEIRKDAMGSRILTLISIYFSCSVTRYRFISDIYIYNIKNCIHKLLEEARGGEEEIVRGALDICATHKTKLTDDESSLAQPCQTPLAQDSWPCSTIHSNNDIRQGVLAKEFHSAIASFNRRTHNRKSKSADHTIYTITSTHCSHK